MSTAPKIEVFPVVTIVCSDCDHQNTVGLVDNPFSYWHECNQGNVRNVITFTNKGAINVK